MEHIKIGHRVNFKLALVVDATSRPTLQGVVVGCDKHHYSVACHVNGAWTKVSVLLKDIRSVHGLIERQQLTQIEVALEQVTA